MTYPGALTHRYTGLGTQIKSSKEKQNKKSHWLQVSGSKLPED